MYCQSCGGQIPEGDEFCSHCGARASAAPPRTTPYFDRDPNEKPGPTFAGFWIRLGAYILDTIFATLLALIPGIILAVIIVLLVEAGQDPPLTQFEADQQDDDTLLGAVIGFVIGYFPVLLGYFYIATALGGGWGKRICGLRIIRNDDGQRPGYGTAAIRVAVTLGFSAVGNIPLVGWVAWLLDYLWMLWDPEKQTLHDKAAGTHVVQV